MIEFHRVGISDGQWIKERLKSRKGASCEYSFGTLFSYDVKVNTYVADYNGCLIIKYDIGNCDLYCYPAGSGDIADALRAIVEEAKASGRSTALTCMSKAEAEFFEALFNGKYQPQANRNIFDYVYLSEDLIKLAGRKYQPKRNHISFFKRTYNWSYEKIDRSNIDECIEMNEQWLMQNDTDAHEDLVTELKIIKRVFENYETLGYVGGLIRVDGKVVAYTMGEPLDDETFCVHFEKAFAQIRGAYPIINQQFVENELSGYKYINREDDVGAENLRKAKLSYHPAFLLEKYVAEIN